MPSLQLSWPVSEGILNGLKREKDVFFNKYSFPIKFKILIDFCKKMFGEPFAFQILKPIFELLIYFQSLQQSWKPSGDFIGKHSGKSALA
jgi:hypothetical protein